MSMPDESEAIQRMLAAQALQQQNQVAGAPAPSPKELLDAYRAFNGGALPPGMTPEQAMQIDMGIGPEMMAANPALAQIILSMQQNNATFNQEAQAARARVGDNYQQLTGDVEQQGQAYMADIMQRMGIDPAAAQYDPTLTGYGETIANMGETADQTQATDQAWFDKMIQVYNQSNQAAMQGLMAAPLIPADGGGGGGGGGFGGGGRRGGRGYGGGSGSGGNGWSDPKTTDALTQTADVTAKEFNPGFDDAVLAMFDDPDMGEYAQQLLDRYGGAPRDVGSGIVKNELPQLQAAIDTAVAQAAQQRLYQQSVPSRTAETASNFAPKDPEALALLPLEEQAAYGQDLSISSLHKEAPAWGTRPGNSAAERTPVRTAPAGGWMDRAAMPLFEGVSKPKDVTSREYMDYLNRKHGNNLEAFNAEYLRDLAADTQVKKDEGEYRSARQNATTDAPFSFEDWDGYVPEIDREALAENEWAREILNQVLGKSREFNPNYDMQVTQRTMKDATNTKTSQTSKDPANQLFDNNLPVSEDVPSTSLFTPFGESRGLGTNLTAAGQRALQNRLEKVRARAEQGDPAQPTGASNPVVKRKPPSPVGPTRSKADQKQETVRNATDLTSRQKPGGWMADAASKVLSKDDKKATEKKKKAAASATSKKAKTKLIRY